MKVVLIDNYDSFVYNIAQYVGEIGAEPVVVRNDISPAEVWDMGPQAVIISPGPGRPEDAGCSVDAVRFLHGRLPVLGVCLGHQAIGAAYGADVVRAPSPKHGKTSTITHNGKGLFDAVAQGFSATRYHSLMIDQASLPAELIVTATSEDGLVMALEHISVPTFGVQFHPESILTSDGKKMIANFLSKAAG